MAALAAALVIGAAVVVLASRGDERRDPAPAAVDLRRCRGLLADASRECWTREFAALLAGRHDPRPAVAAIQHAVRREGGAVLANCHGVMHTVGRTYAAEAGVTLASIRDYLPASNDPGCSAGFAHGLVTGVAPDLDVRHPAEAGAVCAEAATRYQRYSCVHGLGHAFMRIYGDRLGPALELCTALGSHSAADCAQGAYHDYWFAVAGADDASLPPGAVTDPRRLCGAQPARFVRPCWYRVFVDDRPEGLVVDSPEHFDVLCSKLAGLQRQACVTGVALIGPADPAEQLDLCSRLGVADAAACVRATKVQNLLGATTATFVGLIGRCGRFAAAVRGTCYRWLGKTIAVVTDGAFREAGCPQLADAEARRDCRAGAGTLEEALVTFS